MTENSVRGYAYEKQIKAHLLTKHNMVFLWNDIPIDIFTRSRIFSSYADKLKFRRKILARKDTKHGVSDTGCDIYYFDEDEEEWIIVQCKNYTYTITVEKLAGFYDLVISSGLNGELYYTSSLSEPVKRYNKKHIKFIKYPFQEPVNPIVERNLKQKPRDYQIDAYNALKGHKRSILQLPCGMGKTLTAMIWAKRFDIIIIFSPLKQHAQQNLARFKTELDYYDIHELIDSDGTRDINKIIPNLNKKLILSCTYKSHDVINKLAEYIIDSENVGVVIDEFHNLSYDNLMDKADSFYKVFSQQYNYLFISATPRLFDTEKGDDGDEENKEDDYVDNFGTTGKVRYQYDFGKAIKNNYICDYDVFIPDVTMTRDEQMKGVYDYLKITDISNIEYDTRAHFLLRNMEESGHSKCVCYAKDVNDAGALLNAFNRMQEYHALDLYMGTIVSSTNQKNRDKILKDFSETSKKAIICSVRILDECIDIPACDSVFLTSKQTNKIRLIQRVCRANRKDAMNPNKRAGIYVWMNEYEELTELIASLKEFDQSFTKDKVKICNVGDNEAQCVKTRASGSHDEEYGKVDQVIVGITKVDTWTEKLAKLKNYLDLNRCKPSISSDDKDTQSLARWVLIQQANAKSRIRMMKSDDIFNTWTSFIEQYKEYIQTNEEAHDKMMNRIQEFVDKHKHRPSQFSKTHPDEKQMGVWVINQQTNAKNRTQIMKSDEVFEKWIRFIDKNKKYFLTKEEQWHLQFEQAVLHMDKHGTKPSTITKDPRIKKLAKWICQQQVNAKKRTQIMKNDDVYDKWIEFEGRYLDSKKLAKPSMDESDDQIIVRTINCPEKVVLKTKKNDVRVVRKTKKVVK